MTKPSKTQASARAQAHALLNDILGNRRTLDEALARTPLQGEQADQRFTMLLVLSTLQHLGQIDAVLANYLEKPLPPKRLNITNALRLGAAQLLLLDTPAHAAVNESVNVVKKGKDAGLAGLVNAILQKIGREKPALPQAIANLPQWLRTRWEKHYGKEMVATIAELASTRAPLDIHTKQDMGTRLDALMTRITGEHDAVETMPGYNEGAFFVQDVAASYPARLLGDVKDRQVLDVCAAPGGKTMQLIQAGAHVTALDRSNARMKLVRENMARMGMQANIAVADALEWQPSRAYDAILLDAPCTATGTWRRHPEVVQLVADKDIAEMTTLQRAMLTRAWNWLKPGGKLVYCVCSLEPEEGEQQREWFLENQKDAVTAEISPATGIHPEAIKGDYIRTLPGYLATEGGMDGFFAVCFTKRLS